MDSVGCDRRRYIFSVLGRHWGTNMVTSLNAYPISAMLCYP
jgi:hypothetical protein